MIGGLGITGASFEGRVTQAVNEGIELWDRRRRWVCDRRSERITGASFEGRVTRAVNEGIELWDWGSNCA